MFGCIIVHIDLTIEVEIMLNEMIKSLRKSYKISQVELASKLGVTKQCVSNWENDNILPSVDMLLKLSKLFNVSTDYLLGNSTDQIINVSGLTDAQITHIKLLIDDLLAVKEKN